MLKTKDLEDHIKDLEESITEWEHPVLIRVELNFLKHSIAKIKPRTACLPYEEEHDYKMAIEKIRKKYKGLMEGLNEYEERFIEYEDGK